MNKIKLERLYKERNLDDFKLKTIEDLESIHGIRLDRGTQSLIKKRKGYLKSL